MTKIGENIIVVLVAILGSGGFWSVLQKKVDKKDLRSALLLGLAHDRIIYLCFVYLERGSITKEELEALYEYLYLPYGELGGNGSCKVLMERVLKLPISSSIYYHKNDTEVQL